MSVPYRVDSEKERFRKIQDEFRKLNHLTNKNPLVTTTRVRGPPGLLTPANLQTGLKHEHLGDISGNYIIDFLRVSSDDVYVNLVADTAITFAHVPSVLGLDMIFTHASSDPNLTLSIAGQNVDITSVTLGEVFEIIVSSPDGGTTITYKFKKKIEGDTSLAALSDTDIPTTPPTLDGQVLTWITADSLWKPKSPAAATGQTASDIAAFGFQTASDIAAMGFQTASDIAKLGFQTASDIAKLGFQTASDIAKLGFQTASDIAKLGFQTASDIAKLGFQTASDIAKLGFQTASDIAKLGFQTASDIAKLGFQTASDIAKLGFQTASDIAKLGFQTASDIAKLGFQTASDIAKLGFQTASQIAAMGFMAITSFGSTFVSWVDAQTSGIGKIIHDLFDFLGITLPTTNSDGTTTPGDIDLGTRDISNVDRIFFNSNDSVDTSSSFAHITAYGGTMITWIPNSTSLFKVYIPKFPRGYSEIDIGNHFGVRSDLGFTVAGKMTSQANGAIWLDGKTVKIKSDDLEHSISDIGTGGGGTGTPSSSSNILPILKTSSDPSTQSELNTAFGDEIGCIGISVTGNPTTWSDRADIIFWVKTKYYWFGFEQTNNVTGAKNLSGSASTTKQRIAKYTTSTSNSVPSGTYTSSDTVEGDMVLHQESDDLNDGFVGLINGYTSAGAASIRGHYLTDEDKIISAATGTTTTSVAAMGALQVFAASSSAVNSTYLDSAVSDKEGAMGYNDNLQRMYIKANGYWWSMHLARSSV